MARIAQFLSMARVGGFTVKARIYLGSSILVAFIAVIAGLSIWSMSDLGDGLRDNGNLSARTVEVLEIERNVVDMLRNVEAFVASGDGRNAERVKELGGMIATGLDGLSDAGGGEKEAGRIDAMREVLGAFGQIFDKVIQLSEKRRVLLEETMAGYVDRAGKNIEEILSVAWNEGNTGIMSQAGQVQGNLLLAQLAISNFVTDPAEKNAKLAERKIKLVRKRMKSLLGRLSGNSDAASTRISELGKVIVKETPAYRKAFTELVTTIQAIGKALQGEMKGQTDRFTELSGEMKGTGVARLADRQAGMETVISETVQITMIVALAALVVAMLTAWLLGRSVATPLGRMTGAMSKLAKGDLDTVVPDLERGDEVGQMARAVQVFKDNALENDRLKTEQEEAEKRAAQERRQAQLKIAGDFESSIKGVVDGVGTASTQMQNTAESMSATAEETNQQAAAVATASEQATANVQTVATATEEMSASIGEIGRQVTQSAEIAQRAVTEAEKTNVTVQGLAEAAERIGAVVELITGIAEQTNLLALNATIEAARAGDAGKGFAVVASEVKNLANQTAKATEEIGAQIAGMQSAAGEAVEAIGGIGKTITEVDEIAATIAAAVEEQGTATQDIARNVQEAARGTQEVSSNITGVSQGAEETGKAATQVLEAAGQLSQQSEELRGAVDKFLADIKAA